MGSFVASEGNSQTALEAELQRLRTENVALKKQEQLLTQRLTGMRVLHHIARVLNSELNLERLLRMIMQSAVEVMDASAGSLLLHDPLSGELVFTVTEGEGADALQGCRMKQDLGLAGWVFTHHEPLVVNDVRGDPRFYPGIDETFGYWTTSLICAPMMSKGRCIGVIEVLNKRSGEEFTIEEKDILVTLAAQSAIAIENARLYQHLREERDRIVALEEELRRELARDLHDGPAQLLAAIIMNTRFVRELMARDPQRGLDELRALEEVAARALYQVRTMLFDLRPVILETQGLVPALQSYIARLGESEGLQVQLRVEGLNYRLDSKLETAIFAIVQEAVNNIRKHAAATQVHITLAVEGGRELVATISDNGRGFDVLEMERTYDQRGSLGLLNMLERAERIEGRLTVHSQVGQGTIVTLRVPLKA